jgi:hypothetical protein
MKINFDPMRIAGRCLQDAMLESLPSYWASRALDFDIVHPDELPLPLNTSPEKLAQASPAAQAALACRRHAWLLRMDGLPAFIGDEIETVLDEISAPALGEVA